MFKHQKVSLVKKSTLPTNATHMPPFQHTNRSVKYILRVHGKWYIVTVCKVCTFFKYLHAHAAFVTYTQCYL